MRTSKLKTHLLTLVALLALSNINVSAHTARARELCGTVSELDSSSQTIQVKERSGRIRAFVLKKDATLLREWKRADLDAVAPGLQACVYFHSPFFGRPFVTKIIVLNEAQPCPSHGGGLFNRR